jgi:membrane glycosyltransferase
MVRNRVSAASGANPALRRILFGTLVLASSTVATLVLWRILAPGGVVWINAVLLALFAVLFTWICLSFWTVMIGYGVLLAARLGACSRPPAPVEGVAAHGPSRTALLVPIFNEDVTAVFARIEAVYRSLRDTGSDDPFDIFILSDTTDPEIWVQEEIAWLALCRKLPASSRIFYRHRPRNTGFKSGNIADFCRRWGRRYRYMIVLDADSLMGGATMIELVHRMDMNPRCGLIQTYPVPIRGRTLLARMQQFAANLYGPAHVAGAAFWQLGEGNYWGHNAIIRVAPFMQHCGLPRLPGRRPFGGQILSHDFVEAALLVRAGWEVTLAPDLGESYEEMPPTLLANAQRDRRWCQGNLQHLRPLLAHGLHPLSRLHLMMGIMTYLASPLWLLFVAISTFDLWRRAQAEHVYFTESSFFPLWPISHAMEAQFLLGATLAILFLPKLIGLLVLVTDGKRVVRFGGRLTASLGALAETTLSVFVAPVLMAFHTRFVILALRGRDTGWVPQQRDRIRPPFRVILRAHAEHVVGGLGAAIMAYHFVPEYIWWLSPVLAGPILAVPLSLALSSASVGRTAGHRLFLVPSESRPSPLVRSFEKAMKDMEEMRSSSVEGFRAVDRLLVDPRVNVLHAALLSGTGGAVTRPRGSLVRRAARHGISSLSTAEQREALSDAGSVMWMHALRQRVSRPSARAGSGPK